MDWNARYLCKDTPWDYGEAHPELLDWLRKNHFTGEVLVPGCGKGYDVQAIASTGVPTLGVDLSPEAIRIARQTQGHPHARFCIADLFSLSAAWPARFLGAFEHTCYCAISPSQRPDYAASVAKMLQPGATFLACFYMNPEDDDGPPFPTSSEELDQFFHPYLQLQQEWIPSRTFPGREGRELFRQYTRL